MEEILASIRRIIAEDAGSPPAPSAPPPSAAAEPDRTGEDVLDLTEVVEEDGSVVSLAAVNGMSPTAGPELEARAADKPAAEPEPGSKRLISEAAAAASISALSQIAGMAAREGHRDDVLIGAGHRTLEDLIRELLRPMLSDWLDAHLPGIVERLVREEINRLVREAQGR